MRKLLIIALVAMFLMPVALSQAFAAKETAQAGVTDVGNKLCPVSGDPVSGSDFVVYQGKRYGLCCPMCKKPFLKNPEKYLAAMQQGKPAAGMNMAMHGKSSASSASAKTERDMEQKDF